MSFISFYIFFLFNFKASLKIFEFFFGNDEKFLISNLGDEGLIKYQILHLIAIGEIKRVNISND